MEQIMLTDIWNVIWGNKNISHQPQSEPVEVRVVAWPHYLGLDGFNVQCPPRCVPSVDLCICLDLWRSLPLLISSVHESIALSITWTAGCFRLVGSHVRPRSFYGWMCFIRIRVCEPADAPALCQFHCFYLPGKMLDKCGNAELTGLQ